MASREEVYAALDSERAYQDKRWGVDACEGRTPEDHQHSLTEWFAYMRDYVSEAEHKLARGASPGIEREVIHWARKVGALAVAAMEQLGAPRREGF